MLRLYSQFTVSTKRIISGVFSLGLITVAVVQVGCAARPFAGPPGTIDSQRNRAVIHDPFPDNEAGPALMGSRPFGFQNPLHETVRTQTTARANRGF